MSAWEDIDSTKKVEIGFEHFVFHKGRLSNPHASKVPPRDCTLYNRAAQYFLGLNSHFQNSKLEIGPKREGVPSFRSIQGR